MTGTVRSVFWGDEADGPAWPDDRETVGDRVARFARVAARRLSAVCLPNEPRDRWASDGDGLAR